MVDTSPRSSGTSRRPDRLREWVGVGLVLAACCGLLVTVLAHRDDFEQSIARVGPATWVASLLLGMVANLLTIPVWRTILRGLGVQWPVLPSIRLFFTSALGKYLPGSVWPAIMQMEAAARWSTRRSAVVAAQGLTIITTSLTGLLIGLVLLAWADVTAVPRLWWLVALVPLLVVALHPRTLFRLANAVARALGRPGFDVWPTSREIVTASAWSVPLWCVMAGHTFVLAAAMGHGSLHDAVLVAAAVTLAMPAGTLFVPAPAGGGVRELVMVLVLATSMPTGDALALTLTSRVVMIAADAALAVVAWTSGRADTTRH